MHLAIWTIICRRLLTRFVMLIGIAVVGMTAKQSFLESVFALKGTSR